MKPPLFGTWLEETRKLQVEAYGRDPWELDGEEFTTFMTWNAWAAVSELVELMDEVQWKPWSTLHGTHPDAEERKRIITEMVDMLHFAGNMLAAVRCTDLELRFEYQEKMDRNRARMATGKYDARSDKCPGCGRALDDVGTVKKADARAFFDSTVWTLRCAACDAVLPDEVGLGEAMQT